MESKPDPPDWAKRMAAEKLKELSLPQFKGVHFPDTELQQVLSDLDAWNWFVSCLAEAATRGDNPDLDATDGAHPAWWRGNESGSNATADALASVALTGRARVFANQQVERAAQLIEVLRVTDRRATEERERMRGLLNECMPVICDALSTWELAAGCKQMSVRALRARIEAALRESKP